LDFSHIQNNPLSAKFPQSGSNKKCHSGQVLFPNAKARAFWVGALHSAQNDILEVICSGCILKENYEFAIFSFVGLICIYASNFG
jgi:hypothetical protein